MCQAKKPRELQKQHLEQNKKRGEGTLLTK
jgi:hypothetical protein